MTYWLCCAGNVSHFHMLVFLHLNFTATSLKKALDFTAPSHHIQVTSRHLSSLVSQTTLLISPTPQLSIRSLFLFPRQHRRQH